MEVKTLDKSEILEYNGQLSVIRKFMYKMDKAEIAFHVAVPAVIVSLVAIMGYNVVELVRSIFVM